MVHHQNYSLDIRSRVICDRIKGLTYKQCAEKYQISISGIRKMCIKFETTGSVENQKRFGRPPKTSTRTDMLIARIAKQNSTITSRQIVENLKLNVSSRTVQRRLNSSGLINRLQKSKPLISGINKKKRLAFAKLHIIKDEAFWCYGLMRVNFKYLALKNDKEFGADLVMHS
ncbi:uncharacterized protein LOC124818129 [Hydra vulgaris]|uniref:uncharacterized protein LOC124818129 n=1 Tax=Hydra vulgaris TaxID=6087 RepID=UPI001F5F35EF|nr:uncharacterized protein LOC124818129 [Hydra vulgaris]